VHPVHRYSQGEITEAFARSCRIEGADRQVLDRLHAAMGVSTRNLAMPLADLGRFTGFDATMAEFRRVAVPLCEQALDTALRTAGLRPRDVDMLMITSATGVTTPPIDVSVVRRMGLRPDVRRIPSFGLGCAGGAVGLARLHDYLTANPGQVAVLLAVELGSLTVGRDDTSTASFVASGLFDGALDVSWCSLRDVGNLSSASVLHILERTLADRAPASGTPGLLMAIGPGVCAEFVLLNW